MTTRNGVCFVFILVAVSTSSQDCQPNNPDAKLSFRGTPAGEVYVREGHYEMLRCCTTGYTSMYWKKQFEDGYSKYPWYFGDNSVQQDQENQSLTFSQARKIKDGGLYKCVARSDTHVIEHVTRLHIIECEIKNGRIDVTQKPTGPIMAGIGEERAITCEGNFGCLSGELLDRSAAFRYKYKDEPSVWMSNNSRFTIYNYNKNNGTVVGAKLVIASISRDDYDTVFTCVLQTPKLGSKTGFDVTIKPPEINRDLFWLCMLLVPMFLMVMCLVFYCLYKQRVDYFFRRKFGKLPDRGNLENDILLLYNDANRTFVEDHFKPLLKDYKIFDKQSVLLGRREVSELQENIETSYATVIIYTLAFLKDKELCNIFDIAKSTNARIIILQPEEIPEKSFPDDLTDSILKKAPSIFINLKWPWKDPKNSRKLNNFYCKLKKNLPLKQKCKQRQCVTEQESCRPLLAKLSSNSNVENCSPVSEPENSPIRSAPTNILVVPQTTFETQNSNDSGIHSPFDTFSPEIPDIKSSSLPIVNERDIEV